MAALTTNNIVYAGTAPSFVAASASDTAETGPRNFVVYRNAHATLTRTVTIEVPATLTPYTQADNNVEYVVPADGEVWIPLHRDYASSGSRTTITVSDAAADVTVAVVTAGWSE